MDTTLDLAIVRNRLLATKCDARDQKLLVEIRQSAAESVNQNVYARILIWAISNALADIGAGAYELAARELDLAHNIRLQGNMWAPPDEAYFIRGVMATYMEYASVDRIKELFSLFKTA
ncbi:hypothetical protein [Paludibaculum fermentans]|uniref:Uncharacterized protein n=1 Tax=Paludibaculum fermentans TaxID=1473598 RepID=A0A7S7SKP0_PALFE|nr:hypothetical protein [Paludibaculum fermentans]QOY87923.1 hypothetical protein IRI77_35185 [Paludibaculum fermentans]QOY87928.1 hypothetical protein IRI77_35210 [Paludibaculum fermentans]